MVKGRFRLKIVLFSSISHGGLAEHLLYQGRALSSEGCAVTFLVPPDFLAGRALPGRSDRSLLTLTSKSSPGLKRKLTMARNIFLNEWRLALHVLRQRPDAILLASYSEYLAPLWFLPHYLLSKMIGVDYIANLHDPVRNYQVGPAWWHHLSVRCAYLPLSGVLVHQRPPVEAMVPKCIRMIEVPVGTYDVADSRLNSRELRAGWNVPDRAKVLLSFGYVRDNKNIDLVLRALVGVKEVFLVVVGKVATGEGKTHGFYEALAKELGVADRVRVLDHFVPDNEVAPYFQASDFILLAYGASFVSQSGVLNIAARMRKPVLASSGTGPLEHCVKAYRLGVFVPPDSVETLNDGMRRLVANQFESPRWTDYETHASWRANARGLLTALSFSN